MSNEAAKKGKLIILSGPSGVGKTCICNALRDQIPSLAWSISATTRPKRKGEKEGRDYFFMEHDQFVKKIKENYFIEYADVHGSYYGTPKPPVDKTLNSGCPCLMDIDVQGAGKIKDSGEYDLLLIFIAPPDFNELQQRLLERGRDAQEEITKRLDNAARELKMAKFYHHTIVNDNLEQTIEKVCRIVTSALI